MILDDLCTQLEQRRLNRDREFVQLASEIASGKKASAAEVEKTLEAAGHTADDLRKTVEVFAERARLKAIAATAPTLAKTEQSLSEKIIAANEALEKAQQRHGATVGPLADEREAVRAELRAADEAATRLRSLDLCPDSALRQAASALAERIRGVAHKRNAECGLSADEKTKLDGKLRQLQADEAALLERIASL